MSHNNLNPWQSLQQRQGCNSSLAHKGPYPIVFFNPKSMDALDGYSNCSIRQVNLNGMNAFGILD